MRKLKFLFLLAIIFIVSGCSVNYNLEINEDLSLDETVEASETTNDLKVKTNMDTEDAVNYVYQMYESENMEFNYSEDEEAKTTTGVTTRSFDSLKDFRNNFTSDIFNHIEYKKENNTITLTSEQTAILRNSGANSMPYDSVTVNIKLPFNVKENNADSVNDDTYTWYIKKKEKPRTLKLVFNVKTKDKAASIEVGKNVVNINYTYIVLGAIVVSILSLIVFITIKNKKNNMI